MAKLLPPYITSKIKSSGEEQIFNLFNSQAKMKGWIILHSLNISDHATRLYGEIDFVVLAPGAGIFCLEVKSGKIKRKDGIWYYVDRYGMQHEDRRGPFVQARDGMFSLLNAIQKRFGKNSNYSRYIFGFGVLFPHIQFDLSGVDYENWQVFDKDSLRFPISDFITKLSTNTIKKMRNTAWYHKNDSIPNEEGVLKIADFLRGDFEKLISPVDLLADTERRLEKFTEEQYRCLDMVWEGDSCLFRGSAGTGKTMLAIESARRSIALDKYTLLCCFNRPLAEWIGMQFKDASSKLEISNFHLFMMNIIKDKLIPKKRDSDFFKFELPERVLKILNENTFKKFDKLIIDEGQDLITPEYLLVVDSILRGGLSEGDWEIYCDFEKQIIYSEYTANEMLELLEQKASFNKLSLTINCRNTKQIGDEVSLVTGSEIPTFLPTIVNGIPVDYQFLPPTEIKKTLEKTIDNLREQNIERFKITILSPQSLNNSIVSNLDNNQYPIQEISSNSIPDLVRDKIIYSTIHSYKGLENSHIIVTDINSISEYSDKQLLYIAMSRAKVGLHLILNHELRAEYKHIVKMRIHNERSDS